MSNLLMCNHPAAMSPDKKLDWFRRKGWSEVEIADVRRLVVTRWDESYKALSIPATAPTAAEADPAIPAVCAMN